MLVSVPSCHVQSGNTPISREQNNMHQVSSFAYDVSWQTSLRQQFCHSICDVDISTRRFPYVLATAADCVATPPYMQTCAPESFLWWKISSPTWPIHPSGYIRRDVALRRALSTLRSDWSRARGAESKRAVGCAFDLVPEGPLGGSNRKNSWRFDLT